MILINFNYIMIIRQLQTGLMTIACSGCTVTTSSKITGTLTIQDGHLFKESLKEALMHQFNQLLHSPPKDLIRRLGQMDVNQERGDFEIHAQLKCKANDARRVEFL
ncbi:hypothetical protein AX15_006066 [Amanita polypyramis BW_CC]|nr:hypothetical protein AX15_006066 [Amanita polypyramis BW_CC]